MSNLLTTVLAQAYDRPSHQPEADFGQIARALVSHLDIFSHSEALTYLITELHLVWAVIFILVGIACVLNGYRWHKIVVILLAGMSGVLAGRILGEQIGDGRVAAVCFAVLFGVLAWPLLRYAVALFGGLAGAFAGANIWSALDLDPSQHKIGALVGLIVVGMLTFMTFRLVVILMTAVGGASLLVCGVLASMAHVESWREGLLRGVESNQLLVPIIAGSAAVVGAVVQFSGGFKGMAAMADKADPSSSSNKKAA